MQLLTNKWALITGSSRGIGQQIAIGLAKRQCNIFIHGRQESSLQETRELLSGSDVKVHSVWGDLANPDGVQALIKAVNSGPETRGHPL